MKSMFFWRQTKQKQQKMWKTWSPQVSKSTGTEILGILTWMRSHPGFNNMRQFSSESACDHSDPGELLLNVSLSHSMDAGGKQTSANGKQVRVKERTDVQAWLTEADCDLLSGTWIYNNKITSLPQRVPLFWPTRLKRTDSNRWLSLMNAFDLPVEKAHYQ